MEKIYKHQKKRELKKQVDQGGQEFITRGFPSGIIIPRATAPTMDNVKFVWIRRDTRARNDADRGLTKNQLRIIRLFEKIGLGKMIIKY